MFVNQPQVKTDLSYLLLLLVTYMVTIVKNVLAVMLLSCFNSTRVVIFIIMVSSSSRFLTIV